MFNALVMSYSRLPLAMAKDGMMPNSRQKVTRKNETPWVAIVVLPAVGALPRTRLQAPGDSGHYVIRRGADAGVRDPGGAAGSANPDEAGVRVPGGNGGRSHLRNLPTGLLLLSRWWKATARPSSA